MEFLRYSMRGGNAMDFEKGVRASSSGGFVSTLRPQPPAVSGGRVLHWGLAPSRGTHAV